MPVGAFCQENPPTADASDSIRDASRRMAEARVGCLFVVDGKHRPIGVLSDRDVTMKVLRRRRDPDETTIGDVMRDDVIHVNLHTPMLTAFRRMRADGVRRLPVVDDDGALCGVLTWNDALQIISKELQLAADVAAINEPRSAS